VLCNENDCLKQRCFKMGRERMETRKVVKQLQAQCENAGPDHKHTALCAKIEELEGNSASYKQRCFLMGKERMETRNVIKSLKAQCENTGTDHKHDELCGMVEDLRARLMKTQKEKIQLLEEKLCTLCEEDHPEDGRHAELKEENCELKHKHDEMCSKNKALRAKLMKTQKEKIVLLEEKLCTLCEEKHPEDGRHAEMKKKCADLEHNHEGMCEIIEDLRARLMKTQKEKICLLEEKLCTLCEDEHVEDDRHDVQAWDGDGVYSAKLNNVFEQNMRREAE